MMPSQVVGYSLKPIPISRTLMLVTQETEFEYATLKTTQPPSTKSRL